MLRVGFLFNHYFAHQVPHAVPYAFELSRLYPDFEVIIACSSNKEMDLAKDVGTLYPGHHCKYYRLKAPFSNKIIDPIVSMWKLQRKKTVLRNNLIFFSGLDALVSPERNCMNLRTKYGLKDLIMIHTRHGAGDREAGFDERLLRFDFLLLPGQKIADRLNELGLLRKDGFALAGYPKFEVIKGLKREIPRLFRNDNPIVVYNPHFDQSQSSWKPMGHQVLEFFSRHKEFNLIFAPHVVLFKRRMRHGASLPWKYRFSSNIYIDTGSSASIDMTYMLAADIYLGDVSSQVYEFLLKPRPCIFLNGHHFDWESNPFYQHWHLGQVVENIDEELFEALKTASAKHKQYIEEQCKSFADTFYTLPETSAAQRGARAIAEFLYTKAESAIQNKDK